VAIQVGRRSIVNFRPLLGVPKKKSSKAFGFFAKGYLYYYLATGRREYLDIAKEHLAWLDAHSCSPYHGRSWGNAFDFASRGGFIAEGVPTIVWTAHISEAFDLAYGVTKNDRYRDVVNEVAQFITRHIGRLEDGSGICLGYTPGSRVAPIHNSNLLGAVALLRAWKHTGNQQYFNLAKKALDWSCSRANADGSWYYGDSDMYQWIDNFHTAYNLDSLIAAQDLAGSDVVDSRIIERSYRFWIDHFFSGEGRPKYYHDRPLPVDIQCAAQAVESLSRYSRRDPSAIGLAEAVAGWTIDHMQKGNGSFLFRRGRFHVNRLESIHWGQSTMLAGLGCLLYHSKNR
jgi:uncharacterized protein YyaL (SSP411 family)